MSKVYESLKEVMDETLQQSNVNSNPLARVKGTNALTLNNEMEELERIVVDSIARWNDQGVASWRPSPATELLSKGCALVLRCSTEEL
jgi:hypothetical protein